MLECKLGPWKLGLVRYLNALPFHLHLNIAPNSLQFDVPTRLNTDFRKKTLDLSLVSATEFLDGTYHCLPLGISASHAVLSVNLYIREHVDDLDGVVIGLTSQSSASVALLKVICHHFWKMKPHFKTLEGPFSNYAAFLLIGDDALEKQHISGYRRVDLGEVWREETHLPFVFALFATHHEPKLMRPLQTALETSLNLCASDPENLIKAAHTISGLSLLLLAKYYSLFSYRLDEKEFEGLKLFSNLRSSCTKEPSLKA